MHIILSTLPFVRHDGLKKNAKLLSHSIWSDFVIIL